MSMRRRLEFLEGRARQKVAGNSTEARERMSEQPSGGVSLGQKRRQKWRP